MRESNDDGVNAFMPHQQRHDTKNLREPTEMAFNSVGQTSEFLANMARSAASRGDWYASIHAWKQLCEMEPKNPAGYLGQAEAYRGLGDSDAADNALFSYTSFDPKPAEFAVSFALNAQIGENWQEALLRWQAARSSHPEAAVIWAGEAAMLLLLGRVTEADQVTSEGLKKFLNNIEIHAQHFNVAIAAKNWLEAQKRWQDMAEIFPEHEHVLQNRERAKEVIAAGLMAPTANKAQGQKTNLAIWKTLYERNSESNEYIIGYGCALKESEKYDEAEDVFSQALQTQPDNVEIHANFAQIAAARRNWDAAANRWQKIINLFPDVTSVWIMAADAYRQAGWLQDATELLNAAIKLEPRRVELHVHQAMTAEKAGEWDQAVHYWDAASLLSPKDLNIQNSRGDAIWQATMSCLEKNNAPTKSSTVISPETPEAGEHLKKLALSFEGLGDNCEFGIVQRRFGADPIGLFRFAAIDITTLADLAKEKFASLGTRETTELDLTADDEYLIRDTKNPYHMHCFVRKDSVDPEKFLSQQISRINFLKRKLIEDLESAEKIFVYKSSYGTDERDIINLHEVLCQFGANTLLVVQKCSDANSPGSTKILRPNIILGYVETLYNQIDSPIDFSSWKKIMELSYRYKASNNDRCEILTI